MSSFGEPDLNTVDLCLLLDVMSSARLTAISLAMTVLMFHLSVIDHCAFMSCNSACSDGRPAIGALYSGSEFSL
ncbi:hypothetical protein BDR03DRAFT_957137 [Suillus americanus]|nr:hypothetical protein BDR03DRAFT_957137 [Suillus americanus]